MGEECSQEALEIECGGPRAPSEAGGGHAWLGLLAKVFILRDGTLLRSSEELLQLQGGAGGRGQGRGGRGGARQRELGTVCRTTLWEGQEKQASLSQTVRRSARPGAGGAQLCELPARFSARRPGLRGLARGYPAGSDSWSRSQPQTGPAQLLPVCHPRLSGWGRCLPRG